jgi:hypothetical protein
VGDTLNEHTLSAFSDELEKLASKEVLRRFGKFLMEKGLRNPTRFTLGALGKVGKGAKGVLKGFDEAGSRLRHPIEGLRAGWQEMSPLKGLGDRAKALGFNSPQEAASALQGAGNAKGYKKLLGGGEHLLRNEALPGTGRVEATFENLSRSGWTGAGDKTKYLPIGGKSQLVGFTGMAIPSVVNAKEPARTGEGGAFERGMSELGAAGGMLMGSGIGFIPGAALWYGGTKAGTRLGRIIDRVRAGAGPIEAATAPSPEEAVNQLETIRKYYG